MDSMVQIIGNAEVAAEAPILTKRMSRRARARVPAALASGKLRVAIIGTMGLPSRYGGFESLAQQLVDNLSGDFDFTVYCSGPEYKERPAEYNGARLVYLPLKANGGQSIPYDVLNYAHACRHADVLLVLGCSGSLALPLFRVFGKPIILNVGGMDWQRSKWNPWVRRFLHLSEIVGARAADFLVSDNLGIAYHMRKAYQRETALIEYGGDHAETPDLTPALTEKYPFLERPYAFALARIQPDNNPELILHAFNQVPETDLVFVGTWNRSEYGRELKRRYEAFPNLRLLEAIYESTELNAIRGHCSLYVHGHSAGGTNPALVEAMHLGLPVAAFDVAYNRATTEDQAAYFNNVASLSSLLLAVPQSEWDAQRPRMKSIAHRRYAWKRIAFEYARLFHTAGRKGRKSVTAMTVAEAAH
jgi:glycosyltransferase involved in cell wall biosynthesis